MGMDKRVEEELCKGCSNYRECVEKELWNSCGGYRYALCGANNKEKKPTDEMQNFETGAVRDIGGKGRCDLLPMCSLLRVSKHMEDALTHYPERNWEKGLPMHTMVDSAFRHLIKYTDGWDDEDHLCAATTNLLMAMWTEEKRPDMQDIPTRSKSKEVKRVGEVFARGLAEGILSHMTMGNYTVEEDGQMALNICNCYDGGKCKGTIEMDPCNCGGITSKCDFYPDKRSHNE